MNDVDGVDISEEVKNFLEVFLHEDVQEKIYNYMEKNSIPKDKIMFDLSAPKYDKMFALFISLRPSLIMNLCIFWRAFWNIFYVPVVQIFLRIRKKVCQKESNALNETEDIISGAGSMIDNGFNPVIKGCPRVDLIIHELSHYMTWYGKCTRTCTCIVRTLFCSSLILNALTLQMLCQNKIYFMYVFSILSSLCMYVALGVDEYYAEKSRDKYTQEIILNNFPGYIMGSCGYFKSKMAAARKIAIVYISHVYLKQFLANLVGLTILWLIVNWR